MHMALLVLETRVLLLHYGPTLLPSITDFVLHMRIIRENGKFLSKRIFDKLKVEDGNDHTWIRKSFPKASNDDFPYNLKKLSTY